MKIYINARFLSQPISGVQRYGIECSRKIKKYYKEVVILAPKNILQLEIANELGAITIGNNTGHLWEQTDLPRYLKRLNSPPLFNPCNTAPLFYRNNYLALHDLAFFYHPEWNSYAFAKWYNALVPRIVHRSKHIFTVSNTVKAEITEAYNVAPTNISVTYNGISAAMAANHTQHPAKQKEILVVGSFNVRKNHHSLIKAFIQSSLRDTYKLIITGDKNKVFSETGIDEDELVQNNIYLRRNINDQELIIAYNRAEVLVSLSQYEGFGIPVLEGVYHGCKVVCSDITVYRELYSTVATFCNQNNINDINRALQAAIQESAPPQEEVSALCAKYSYEISARTIVDVMTRNAD